MSRKVHVFEIGALRRELPLFEVKPGLSIAVLNILGDVELVEAAATALAPRLEALDATALVTPEAKSIPLVYALAVRLQLPYVVLRKNYKSYMGDALSMSTNSITTGAQQTLYLDEKDHALIEHAPVVLVDDVVSTGSTLRAMRSLMQRANAQIAGETAICTEGAPEDWPDVIALGHLPLFTGDA